MKLLRWSAVTLLLFVAVRQMSAQTAQPRLEVVLARVRANIEAFNEKLPNLGSDETVVSDVLRDGEAKDSTTIVSTFRVLRGADGKLSETRTKLTINGEPVPNQDVAGTFNLDGGIVGVLSLPDNPCHTYHLETSLTATEEGKLVLSEYAFHAEQDHKTCTKHAFTSRFLIDPVSFQVVRIEVREEDMHFGTMTRFLMHVDAQNTLDLTTDLAPIQLGTQIFWLPTQVIATLTAKRKPITMRYRVSYTNYHRFGATVSIGPVTQVPGQP